MTKKQMLLGMIICIFTNSLAAILYDKSMQDDLTDLAIEELSWIEKNKAACSVGDAQRARDNEQTVLLQKIFVVCTEMLLLQKEGRDMQFQQYHKQNQQYALQKQFYTEQLDMQKQQRYDMVSLLLQDDIRELELLRQKLIKSEEENVQDKIKSLSAQKEHFEKSFELQAKSFEIQAKLKAEQN